MFEVALAEDLQISRTPIHAALSQLAEEGLLERIRGGGFVVPSFVLRDVVDTVELCGVLNGTAARLAAERGRAVEHLEVLESTLAAIDGIMLRCAQDIDLEDYSALNIRFHTALAAASGCAVIQREIERVTRLPFAALSVFLGDHLQSDSFRRSLLPAKEQHRAIIVAIRLRKGARAEQRLASSNVAARLLLRPSWPRTRCEICVPRSETEPLRRY